MYDGKASLRTQAYWRTQSTRTISIQTKLMPIHSRQVCLHLI